MSIMCLFAADEGTRKIAWAVEYAPTAALNAHIQRRTREEVCRATSLPKELLGLIIAYEPYRWSHHVVPISDDRIHKLLYVTAATACSYDVAVHDTRQRSYSHEYHTPRYWNIENGDPVDVSPPSPSLIHQRPWQLQDAADEGELFMNHAISPNGQVIAAYSDKALYVWPATQALLRSKHPHSWLPENAFHIRNNPHQPIRAVTFSPCSNYLFIAKDNTKVHGFNVRTNTHVCTFIHDQTVTALACNSNGSELLVGTDNGTVYVWRGTPFDAAFTHDIANVSVGPEQQSISDDQAPAMLPPLPQVPLRNLGSSLRAIGSSYCIECCSGQVNVTYTHCLCCALYCCAGVTVSCPMAFISCINYLISPDCERDWNDHWDGHPCCESDGE